MADNSEIIINSLTEALEAQKELNRIQAEQNKALQQTITELNGTIASLNETVEYLKKKIFGRTSEKTPDPNQLTLDIFNEAEKEADPALPEPTEGDLVQFTKGKGRRKDRDSILKDIPVTEVVCKVEDRICPECGSEMIYIGKQFVREELVVIPAKLKRVKYFEEVYKCPSCSDDETDYIVEAEPPLPLMKHSLASPEAVAYIMYKKYAVYVPLYRLEKEYAQMGAYISRGVMANWITHCSLKYFKPLYDLIHTELLSRDILHGDEVPCQVLKEPGKTPQSKSYMWVFLTGNDGLPGITLYNYKPGRKGEYAKEFLKGFRGYLHCDGYQGYNGLNEIVRVGCIAHVRRYFFEAIPSKKEPDAPKAPAETGVEYLNKLFMLERSYKGLAPDVIKQKREEEETPILEEFFAWLDTLSPRGGSRLEKAVNHARNQKQNLLNYLKDGRLEISNNAAERRCKSYVMGRRNFLFHDQVDGAEASAIIYSLVETAKMNGLNIYSYLKTVLTHMPGRIKRSEGIDDLLPWSDFIQESCPKVEQKTTEMRPVGME